MRDPRCRLCGSDELHLSLTLERAPRNVQGLLRPHELSTDLAISLSVYTCARCGLVQLAESLAPEYYHDYLMTVSHSPQMQELQQAQSSDFVRRYGLSGKRVIELGCGDGNYLACLRLAGCDVTGLEASRRFQQSAQERGFPVLEGYVRGDWLIPGAPYDGFVARQVLEHVPDPNDFLQGVRRALSSSGVGLVEVPSLEQALEARRFYDFFSDHVSYFSSATLRHALERNGFDVLEVTRAMNGEYNVAIVRNRARPDFAATQTMVQRLAHELGTLVANHQAQGSRVAVWGAGGKGVVLLAAVQVPGIAYLVDSDPHKEGLFTPVSHLPVYLPERLLTDPVDTVVVTALAYRDEILAQLRGELSFEGMIVVVGDEGITTVGERRKAAV